MKYKMLQGIKLLFILVLLYQEQKKHIYFVPAHTYREENRKQNREGHVDEIHKVKSFNPTGLRIVPKEKLGDRSISLDLFCHDI